MVVELGKSKRIEGFENYLVFKEGLIWSCKNTCQLLPIKTPNGYFQVNLYKEGKPHRRYVHRLVAKHFVPNPNNFPEVNHIDEVKSNNEYSNLEWTTPKRNVNHGTGIQRRAKSQSKGLIQMNLHGVKLKEFRSLNHAKEFGFDPSNVSKCCRGLKKTSNGYKWKYKDQKNE